MSCTAGTRMQLNQSSTKMGFLDALSGLVNHDELPRSTRGPESLGIIVVTGAEKRRAASLLSVFTTACHQESLFFFLFFSSLFYSVLSS